MKKTALYRWAVWPLGLVAVAALMLSMGCQSPRPTPPTPGLSTPEDHSIGPTSIDLIRVGDKVEVSLSDVLTPYPTVAQRVREDGTISLPLNVSVVAAGKKAGELEAEIHAAFVPKYFNRVTVNVRVEERVLYVGGQVRRPDRYVYVGEMTLLGVIKMAGDFTEYAKKTQVQVTRKDGTRFVINCKKALKDQKYDIPVYPGDNIYVPTRVW